MRRLFGCTHQLPLMASPTIASVRRGALPLAEARTTPCCRTKANASSAVTQVFMMPQGSIGGLDGGGHAAPSRPLSTVIPAWQSSDRQQSEIRIRRRSPTTRQALVSLSRGLLFSFATEE